MPKSVLVISSFVARGSVGGRAGFVFERLGHELWYLPTVLLPWHPGHSLAHRHVMPDDAFAGLADDLARAKWLGDLGAIVTGYFATPGQARIAAGLIAAVRAVNPAVTVLADPVIGDGGLYVPEPVARAVADHLLPIADIATPNRFELGWLTGRDVSDLDTLVAAAAALGPQRVAVTSAPALMRGRVGSVFVTPKGAWMAENPAIEGHQAGAGDLFAAVLLSRLMAGAGEADALAAASSAIYEVIAHTAAAGRDELDLTGAQDAFGRLSPRVDVRRLGEIPA